LLGFRFAKNYWKNPYQNKRKFFWLNKFNDCWKSIWFIAKKNDDEKNQSNQNFNTLKHTFIHTCIHTCIHSNNQKFQVFMHSYMHTFKQSEIQSFHAFSHAYIQAINNSKSSCIHTCIFGVDQISRSCFPQR